MFYRCSSLVPLEKVPLDSGQPTPATPATETKSAEAGTNTETKASTETTVPADKPAVFCQKGKCYPYDPAKLKNAKIPLEVQQGKKYYNNDKK